MSNVIQFPEQEHRELDNFLRGDQKSEYRTVNVSDNNMAIIPSNVENQVILKLSESSPAFENAKHIPSKQGNLSIPKENGASVAGFVGENENLGEEDLDLGKCELKQTRVGSSLTLSKQLMMDSAVDLIDYGFGRLTRSTSKAIERSMFTGNQNEEFRGIIYEADIPTISLDGSLNIDHLNSLFNGIHPEFLDNSGFYMSRGFFNQVSQLKDGTQNYYLQNGIINGRITKTLFGTPVYVTDALPDSDPCVFGNMEAGYAILWKSEGFHLKRVAADTKQAIRGSQLIVLDGYMDGATYNSEAFVKLKVTDTESTAA